MPTLVKVEKDEFLLRGMQFPGAPGWLGDFVDQQGTHDDPWWGSGSVASHPAPSVSPWRQEPMIPPDAPPGTFAFERQWSAPGPLYLGRQGWPKKPYTPWHYARQFPIGGGLDFNTQRIPKMSYRTQNEVFTSTPYWDVKPVFGPRDWPTNGTLFPRVPTQEEVDNIVDDVMPLFISPEQEGDSSVVNLQNLLGDGPATGAYLSGLGQAAAEVVGGGGGTKETNVEETGFGLSQLLIDLGIDKGGAGAIDAAAGLAAQLYVQGQQEDIIKEQRKLAEAQARAGIAQKQVLAAQQGLDYRESTLEPKSAFYTSPWFLGAAGVALAAGGYYAFVKK